MLMCISANHLCATISKPEAKLYYLIAYKIQLFSLSSKASKSQLSSFWPIAVIFHHFRANKNQFCSLLRPAAVTSLHQRFMANKGQLSTLL
jgi:hypothetical protein